MLETSAPRRAAADVVYYLAAQVAVTSSVAQRNGSRCTAIFRVFDDDTTPVSLFIWIGCTEFRRVVSGIYAGPTQGELVTISEGLATSLI
jgi:hypothetical protein